MGLNELLKIGDKIKELRKEKGVTQKQAAEELNISYSTYSNYENNNRTPDIETLCDIADYLGVNVSILLGTPDVNEHDIYFDFLSVFTDWIVERGYSFDFSHDGKLFVENGGYQSVYLTKNGQKYAFSPYELKKYQNYLKTYFDVMLMEKENQNNKDNEPY